MKRICLLLMTMIMAFTTIGCSNDKDNQISEDKEKITVYTTIFPIYDFARNIGKDKIDLNYIIAPGVEPHDYEITPKTLKDIQEADLLIKNGIGIDSFMDKVESESNLKIVTATDGIEPLAYNKEDDDSHDHEHEHNESCEHSHGEYDPHIWLDIDLAIKQCENIKNALISVDEENKDYYEANYNEYIDQLEALGKEYDENLKDLSKDTIVVSHDAYGYLCHKYNINQHSVTGITPNQEPSLSKISEISDFVKENGIEYILFDGLVNPKVSQTIADESGIKTEVLYSIDGINKDAFDSGESYLSLMNKNLETLKLILK